MSYSDLEYEIFSRQFILKEFNEENIKKIQMTKIFIIGLGGIGCPLGQYLVSSGFKYFTFFDKDKIEETNLARQILYGTGDVGKFKTDIAKSRLLKTNPNCKITTHTENLTKKNVNLLLGADIVIDASDDWQTSKLINKYCVQNSLKFIFSSAINNNIEICFFNNTNKHTCLNCLFPNNEDVELPRCETVGISSICAGIAGLITAQKTINIVLELQDESDILTLIDSTNLNINNIKVKNNVKCALNNS